MDHCPTPASPSLAARGEKTLDPPPPPPSPPPAAATGPSRGGDGPCPLRWVGILRPSPAQWSADAGAAAPDGVAGDDGPRRCGLRWAEAAVTGGDDRSWWQGGLASHAGLCGLQRPAPARLDPWRAAVGGRWGWVGLGFFGVRWRAGLGGRPRGSWEKGLGCYLVRPWCFLPSCAGGLDAQVARCGSGCRDGGPGLVGQQI